MANWSFISAITTWGVRNLHQLPIVAGIVVVVGALGASSADAQIVSATAEYNRGSLVIRGKTAKPRQVVSLNRFHMKRSNRAGDFVFRRTRIPRNCVVRLWSDGDLRVLPVRNCPLHRR